MDIQSLGRSLIAIGLLLAFSGVILMAVGRVFPSSGNMPGDIEIQSRNFSCFAPIGTMLLVSLLLTIVLNIVIRLLNR